MKKFCSFWKNPSASVFDFSTALFGWISFDEETAPFFEKTFSDFLLRAENILFSLERNYGIVENTDSAHNVDENNLERTDAYKMILQNADLGFDGFIFTSFAENYGKITELSLDIIVEDSDGVFSIMKETSGCGLDKNPAFQTLVDSVLG